jgi:hypothetical protein
MIMTSRRPQLRRVIRALQKRFKNHKDAKFLAMIARAKQLHKEGQI